MSALPRRDADAVRYVVLRKLASGLRHALMGELQSIQFLAELGARLLRTGANDSQLHDCVGKIPAATGAAIATCQSMIEWLRPEDRASARLADVVGQCAKLAGDDWRMRGIEATVDLSGPAAEALVQRAPARELVVAALLTMTDTYPGPQDIEVSATLDGQAIALRLRRQESARPTPLPSPPVCGPALGLDDFAVLAAAHGTDFSHEHGSLTLRLTLAKSAQDPPQTGSGPPPP
jgi:hypothetical protein